MRILMSASAGLVGAALTIALAANNVPVPQSCNSDVNSRLAQLITGQTRQNVDNVMVCGITTKASQPQRPGKHGGHQILSLRTQLPGIGTRLIQVAINDTLD